MRTFASATAAWIVIRSRIPRSPGDLPEDANVKDFSLPPRTIPKISADGGIVAEEREELPADVRHVEVAASRGARRADAAASARRVPLESEPRGFHGETREGERGLPFRGTERRLEPNPSKARLPPPGRASTTRLGPRRRPASEIPANESACVQSVPPARRVALRRPTAPQVDGQVQPFHADLREHDPAAKERQERRRDAHAPHRPARVRARPPSRSGRRPRGAGTTRGPSART